MATWYCFGCRRAYGSHAAYEAHQCPGRIWDAIVVLLTLAMVWVVIAWAAMLLSGILA